MSSKAKIKQQAMKNAIRIWELKNSDQLDPTIKYLIESFCELNYENENSVEDIKERLLEQIANFLTPDSFIASKPAHSIMQVMPIEPEIEIDRKAIFYTNKLPNEAIKYGLKTVCVAPVADHIKLVRGEIRHLLCERELYRTGLQGEKDLFTRASVFCQDLNRSVWIGFDLDKQVPSLKDIHFYFDFPNTPHRYDLYDLLSLTKWTINGQPLTLDAGMRQSHPDNELTGGIFAHYNLLQMNDEEVMDLYRKQFLHIRSNIRTASLEKLPFPTELMPFFPERVKELEAQYWIKVEFPPYFKKEDIDDINIYLNAFPVSNKNLNTHTLYANKSLTGIIPLPVSPGEYFLAVEDVEDTDGGHYTFLPYTLSEISLAGTYTIKRGGLERFSTRDLKELVEQMVGLLRSELVTFTALKIDNINNSIMEVDQIIRALSEKMNKNNSNIKETPTYLLIDPEGEKSQKDITAVYWSTNCQLANSIPFGILFNPLKAIALEKDSCFLLKATSGGKTAPRKDEMLMAYKYALTTRDQLFSIKDIENYCCMKLSDHLHSVKVMRGIACSNKQKEGLIRTIDVCLIPAAGYNDYFCDPAMQGELKTELEKRSPSTYNFRILIESDPAVLRTISNNSIIQI